MYWGGGSTHLELTHVHPVLPLPSLFAWLRCIEVVLKVRLLNEGVIVVYFNVSKSNEK
jgi:hypothetical protein